MSYVLFWDIDGTLLTTARAGIFAWEEAARVVLGRSVDLSLLKTAGLTDPEIAVKVLESHGLPVAPESRRRLVRAYEFYLPTRLQWRRGRVLPGVREILDSLRDRRDVLCLLLTGNTQAGASAKLKHYGLEHYFVTGAYAEDGLDRPAIARKAVGLASQVIGQEVCMDSTFVIGDTPHDILCGKEIGAKTIAVASGEYAADELGKHSPWWVVERLPAHATFAEKLGIKP